MSQKSKMTLEEWVNENHVLLNGVLGYYIKEGKKEYQPWATKALKQLEEITGVKLSKITDESERCT